MADQNNTRIVSSDKIDFEAMHASLESVEDALLALLGEAKELDDSQVQFKVGSPPSYAVNGASVPIEILTEAAEHESKR